MCAILHVFYEHQRRNRSGGRSIEEVYVTQDIPYGQVYDGFQFLNLYFSYSIDNITLIF